MKNIVRVFFVMICVQNNNFTERSQKNNRQWGIQIIGSGACLNYHDYSGDILSVEDNFNYPVFFDNVVYN